MEGEGWGWYSPDDDGLNGASLSWWESEQGDKLMYGVSDPEPVIMIQTYRPTHTHCTLHWQTTQQADCEAGRYAGSWSKSIIQSTWLHAAQHQTAFITSVCWPANSCSPSYLGRPVRQAHRPWPSAASLHKSAACYQLSNWISGTNVITAGVFIYIIIITALPRGARGEHQGLGRDEGWDSRGEEGK